MKYLIAIAALMLVAAPAMAKQEPGQGGIGAPKQERGQGGIAAPGQAGPIMFEPGQAGPIMFDDEDRWHVYNPADQDKWTVYVPKWH